MLRPYPPVSENTIVQWSLRFRNQMILLSMKAFTFAGRECARLHGTVRGICLEALLTVTNHYLEAVLTVTDFNLKALLIIIYRP